MLRRITTPHRLRQSLFNSKATVVTQPKHGLTNDDPDEELRPRGDCALRTADFLLAIMWPLESRQTKLQCDTIPRPQQSLGDPTVYADQPCKPVAVTPSIECLARGRLRQSHHDFRVLDRVISPRRRQPVLVPYDRMPTTFRRWSAVSGVPIADLSICLQTGKVPSQSLCKNPRKSHRG